MLPGRMAHQRVAGDVESHVIGQTDGKLVLRHRHDTAGGAVHDRNGAAPVALARNAPVAQAVHRLARALGDLLHPAGDLGFGIFDGEAVQEVGVGNAAGADVGLAAKVEGGGVLAFRDHHGYDRQRVLGRELEVALVMSRAAEDGACAVAHQDEIGDEDGQLPIRDERVRRGQPRVEALLLDAVQVLLGGADVTAFLDEGG